MRVKINGQRKKGLTLYFVDCGKNALFGRDWFKHFQLNWSEIHAVFISDKIQNETSNTHVQRLINKHQPIFEKGIGKLKGPSAKFQLKPDAKPIFIKARKVPFALPDKVNNELKRLEKDGIISPVKISDYATPIVRVIKRDCSVRICADFKVTLNTNIEP